MADILDGPVVVVAVDDVKPHPSNARQGDIGAIVESIRAHGIYKPLIVQRSTGHVLAGNHTLAALKALEVDEVPVQYVDVTDDEALRILLVDNRTSDIASYDDALLAELLTTLAAESETELAGTGFTGDDLDQLLRDLDTNYREVTGAVPSTERLDQWAQSELRQIVLILDPKEFEGAVATLGLMREVDPELDSNTACVLRLLNEWADAHGVLDTDGG